MRTVLRKVCISGLSAFLILIFSFNAFCDSSVIIKDIKRLPKQRYILNEYEELIGARYNINFYRDHLENYDILFVIRMECRDLQSCKVILFYKVASKNIVQKKTIEITAPEKIKQIVKIRLTQEELLEKGKPDLWWVEVRDIDGETVLAEKGVEHYREVRERLQLITQLQKDSLE